MYRTIAEYYEEICEKGYADYYAEGYAAADRNGYKGYSAEFYAEGYVNGCLTETIRCYERGDITIEQAAKDVNMTIDEFSDFFQKIEMQQ